MEDIILQLDHIKKSFDDTQVLNNIDLSIKRGEFITLLGSSGCGKTTTLRIIAGLEAPDSGRVLLEGKDVTTETPNKRNVNTVFQNYALFPHMSVESNIGYSLRLKRAGKAEIKKAVTNALETVQLSGFEKRMPNELSGGQRQRVAIARAIVNNPKVLLLDEPLGALDLQLRRQLQIELKRLQKRLGITFVYITHDQEEALNMSDRIVVMHSGGFEQIGTPTQIYDNPKTSYVAKFVGSANILTGFVQTIENNIIYIETADGIATALHRNSHLKIGQKATLAIRSEQVNLRLEAQETAKLPTETFIRGTVTEKSFSAGMSRISVILSDGTEFISSRHGIDSNLVPDDKVVISWLPEDSIIVDAEAPYEEA